MSDDRLWDSPRRLDRLSLTLLVTGLALLCCGSLYWLLHRPSFGIDQVRIVETPIHVTPRQLEDVVRRELRGNFFTMDLQAARQAFARLPWVREAGVARRWPGTLEVRIVEHEAVAVWQTGGLVDRQGDVFEAATEADLPLLGGPPGTSRLLVQRYVEIQRTLSQIGLTPRAVELSPRHAWTIELAEGPRIDLGRTADLAPLQRFVAIYPQHIEALMPRIGRIDLRYRNGLALGSRDGTPLLTSARPSATPPRRT